MALFLTVGMATYDDFDGVWFSVQSIRTHHPDVPCEIIVVDNNPGSDQGRLTREFIREVPGARYVAMDKPVGSCPPRERIFDEAQGEVVVCMDSHVLLLPGSLAAIRAHFRRQRKSRDLIHGPLMHVGDSSKVAATHMVPVFKNGMFGVWGLDRVVMERDSPFMIPMHGLGLFACRKDAWPGFHSRFEGFSGGEGYIHDRIRMLGGRVLCLPAAKWVHRFRRIRPPYQPRSIDKVKNLLRGRLHNGQPVGPIRKHFVDEIGAITRDNWEKALATVRAEVACDAQVSDKPSCRSKDSKSERQEPKRVAIAGNAHWGSYKMRAAPLLRHIRGASSQHPTTCPVGIAVKCTVPATFADRIIYDPLDAFFTLPYDQQQHANAFWALTAANNEFVDEVIATSPTALDMIRQAFGPQKTYHLIPHAADPRVDKSWHNPDGHIVYAGHPDFLGGRKNIELLHEAAKRAGRRLIISKSLTAMHGAALVLAVRLGASATKLNRTCKPCVKVANAAAAGIPVLATDDRAIISQYSVIHQPPAAFADVPATTKAVQTALESPAPDVLLSHNAWLDKMTEILS